MNDVTIFIYLVFFVVLAAATFAYMFKMMTSTLAEFDKRPVRSYGDAMRAYRIHPEEPKDGEEVMGVTFKCLFVTILISECNCCHVYTNLHL